MSSSDTILMNGRMTVTPTTLSSVLLAQEAAEGFGGLILPVVFLGLLYMLLIRPQTKRRKELQKLVASLQVGDLVATLGGLHGEVVALEDGIVDLAVTEDAQGRPDVILRFDRAAIARVLEHAGSPEGGAA